MYRMSVEEDPPINTSDLGREKGRAVSLILSGRGCRMRFDKKKNAFSVECEREESLKSKSFQRPQTKKKTHHLREKE